MFQHIIVPLDGSKGAERAIPIAARMARVSGGSLLLMRVVLPPVELGKPTIHYTRMWERPAFENDRTKAASYLAGVMLNYAQDLAGINTDIGVASGLVPEAICATALQENAELIVMCSHGDRGLKRWLFGGVAHEVTCKSSLPVLVLNEHGGLVSASHGAHLV